MTEKKDFEDIFNKIDFDQVQKEAKNISPGDRDRMVEDFLLNFPIENYANTINQIFKIFKGTKDHHAFVVAMKEHLKKQGK